MTFLEFYYHKQLLKKKFAVIAKKQRAAAHSVYGRFTLKFFIFLFDEYYKNKCIFGVYKVLLFSGEQKKREFITNTV